MPVDEFLEFYRENLNLTENDFNLLQKSIEDGLPSTFRITPTFFSDEIKKLFAEFDFITKVPYLNDVYTFDLKNKTEEYKKFISILVAQTNIGNIQRQEIVSFLPHLFLDVQSNHVVLETCASPGSKTKNLLEIIKTGLLISNDKSSSRVNVLISEAMKKSSTSFIVTQMDAAHFPNTSVQFDRICCDVPCSSDGTFRKNKAILPKWNIKDAIGLSSVQLKILKRSLELLKENGILVYSTCSLNPIENEWVISHVVDDPSLELVSDFDFVQYQNINLDKITVRKGITSFKYKQFEFNNEKLAKCMRIMPQDQNTGGFFITVIRKKSSKQNLKKNTSEIKLNSIFCESTPEIMEKVKKTYNISHLQDKYVSFNQNYKNLYALSPLCYKVLEESTKLKVCYAGIKAFTESDLRSDVFRIKSAYMEAASISTDYTMSLEDFVFLLKDKDVDVLLLSFKPKDIFTVTLANTPLKFCGFSSGKKAFLYIDSNHRLALAQLYIK